MRVAGRAAAAAIAALAAGLIVSWIGAVWLRSAVPQAGLIWRIAPPAKVAVWTLAGAHGASLHLEAGAEVDENVARIGDRIGDLLGREGGLLGGEDGSAGPRADLDVRLSSLTVLACAGLVMTLVMRLSGAQGLRDVALGPAIAGGIYGIALAALTASADARLGFDLRIVSAGIEARASPAAAGLFGTLWGAAFAVIGALSAPAVAEKLSPMWRAVGAGLRRAALVSAVAAVGCLILLAFTQQGGEAPGLDPSLGALGAVLLGANVIAAAVVLAHGPTMQIALDAGPLAEWSQLGYLTRGDQTLSPARWLFVLVPLLGGIAAGRVMRKRVAGADAFRVAAAFGAIWGVALTVLTLLLRVRVLSNFSLTSLESGGTVAIDPLITLVLSSVWGGITAYIGLVAGPEADVEPLEEPARLEPQPVVPSSSPAPATVPRVDEPSAAARSERPCANCGRPVPAEDRFCMACGTAVT